MEGHLGQGISKNRCQHVTPDLGKLRSLHNRHNLQDLGVCTKSTKVTKDVNKISMGKYRHFLVQYTVYLLTLQT